MPFFHAHAKHWVHTTKLKVPIVHGILVGTLVRAKYILLSNIRVNEVLLGLKKQPKLIFIIIKKKYKIL